MKAAQQHSFPVPFSVEFSSALDSQRWLSASSKEAEIHFSNWFPVPLYVRGCCGIVHMFNRGLVRDSTVGKRLPANSFSHQPITSLHTFDFCESNVVINPKRESFCTRKYGFDLKVERIRSECRKSAVYRALKICRCANMWWEGSTRKEKSHFRNLSRTIIKCSIKKEK